MTLHAAWTMDTQGARAARTQVALIKFFGAKVLHDVVDRALQLHGSLGYSTDLPLEQMYRFARAARIYDGPDEVHRQSVARQILAGYAAARRRRAQRAPADAPRAGARALRRAARDGHRERLGARAAPSPRASRLGRWQRAPSQRRRCSTRRASRASASSRASSRADGRVTLSYALDEELAFAERLDAARRRARSTPDASSARTGLLALLHWVAGRQLLQGRAAAGGRVRVGRAAARPRRRCSRRSTPRASASSPTPTGCPRCRGRASRAPAARRRRARAAPPPSRAARARRRRRRQGLGRGDRGRCAARAPRWRCSRSATRRRSRAPRTAAGLPRLIATRRARPAAVRAATRPGAINGHVPITAIVSCVALLTAALNGFDAVAMANERSASAGNLRWDGVEINHQFSKSLARGAAAERGRRRDAAPAVRSFSVLRPASELAIARAFAGMERYHDAFTSCNAIFRIDPALRASSWCCDCPKCRFVFLALAPFSSPEHLRRDLRRATCSPTSRSSRASRCSRRAAATSRSSASARSRRASPRCGCWPPTRAGASTRSCGGSPPRCCRAASAARGRSRRRARAERRPRRAGRRCWTDVRALLGA